MELRGFLAVVVLAFALTVSSCSPDAVETEAIQEDVVEVLTEEEQAPLPTFELSDLRVDSELCKFEDNSLGFNGQTPPGNRKEWEPDFNYFPNQGGSEYFFPTTGEVNLALVFLDWSDKLGTPDDVSYYLDQADKFARWYQTISQGKLTINWRLGEDWNELEGSWEEYKRLDNENYGENERAAWEQWFVDQAVAASDDAFDYSDIDYVVFVMPKSGSIGKQDGMIYSEDTIMTTGTQGMAYDVHPGNSSGTVVRSQEKSIGNWVISGTTFQDEENRSPSWVHWAHEMGHMFGFIAHAPMRNPPATDEPHVSLYDNTMYGVGLFSDGWIVTRVVSSWDAWLAGWLDDSQVLCVNAEDIQDEIFAINSFRNPNGSTKSLIIRTSETSGLVIESRDWNSEFDYETSLSREGLYNAIVMYNIDSTRWIGDQSLIALAPGSVGESWDEEQWPGTAKNYTDIYFHEGDTAQYEGLIIEPLSLQEGVDYVRVSRSAAGE
jgi:hypothetical protein